MITNKDVNHKLAEYLTDIDLLSLNSINKYYYKVFDDQFWRRRFLDFYSKNLAENLPENYNVYNESWKKYYFIVKKKLDKDRYDNAIKFCIEEDRVDLLEMIYNKYKCSYKIINNHVTDTKSWFSPISYSIKKDSYRCFEYIFKNISTYFTHIYFRIAILNHAHKIVEYLFEETIEKQLLFVFDENCLICAKILENKFLKYQDKIMNILYDCNPDFIKNLKNHKTFTLFIRKIKDRLPEYKKRALEKERFDIFDILNV